MQLLQESPIEKEALHRAVNYPKNNNKKEGIFSGKGNNRHIEIRNKHSKKSYDIAKDNYLSKFSL